MGILLPVALACTRKEMMFGHANGSHELINGMSHSRNSYNCGKLPWQCLTSGALKTRDKVLEVGVPQFEANGGCHWRCSTFWYGNGCHTI